jgi:hypothetical protein
MNQRDLFDRISQHPSGDQVPIKHLVEALSIRLLAQKRRNFEVVHAAT